MKHVPYKAATQTSDGNKEYYYCESCGKWFWDAEGVNEITNKSEVIIPRTGSASSTGSTVSTGNNPSVRTTATPGTGDDTPSGFYLAMMAIAALGLILILTQRFRKDTH